MLKILYPIRHDSIKSTDIDCDLPKTRHNRPKVIAKAAKTTCLQKSVREDLVERKSTVNEYKIVHP